MFTKPQLLTEQNFWQETSKLAAEEFSFEAFLDAIAPRRPMDDDDAIAATKINPLTVRFHLRKIKQNLSPPLQSLYIEDSHERVERALEAEIEISADQLLSNRHYKLRVRISPDATEFCLTKRGQGKHNVGSGTAASAGA